MRAYSLDLRQRIVGAIDRGGSRTEVARQFEVAVRTVDRYVRQARETGDLNPTAVPRSPSPLVADR